MFTIRAATGDKFEVAIPIQRVREFFTDTRNFVELMPNVESIHTAPDGSMRWTIRADIPIVGAMRQSFNVELSESSEECIEWRPKTGERENLLRYAADFLEKGEGSTLVQFSQNVELRRERAKDLHLLAGLAGEKRVSQGMQWEVAEMIKKFVQKAKEKLDNPHCKA